MGSNPIVSTRRGQGLRHLLRPAGPVRSAPRATDGPQARPHPSGTAVYSRAVVIAALVVIVVVRLVVIARQEPIPSASWCSRE